MAECDHEYYHDRCDDECRIICRHCGHRHFPPPPKPLIVVLGDDYSDEDRGNSRWSDQGFHLTEQEASNEW